MVETRERFISRISNCLGRNKVPAQPSPLQLLHDCHNDFMKDASRDELADVFIRNSKLSGASIYQCVTEDLNHTIVQAVRDFGGGEVLLADQAIFQEQETLAELQSCCDLVNCWDLTMSREQNIANAEKAAVGIAKAEYGLAESGTVVLFSHRGTGRSVSLLPTSTVTVIFKQNIYPRLTQAMTLLMEQQSKGLPNGIHFISGPSSTADIELVRVQGVHGPINVSTIIVD